MDQKVKIVAVLASVAAVVLLIMVVVKSNQLGDANKSIVAKDTEIAELKKTNEGLDADAKNAKNECQSYIGEVAKLNKRLEGLGKQLMIKQAELDRRATRTTTSTTPKTSSTTHTAPKTSTAPKTARP